MSLTTGRGPLGRDPAGRLTSDSAGGHTYVEPLLRRVRAVLGGRTVIDSERALLVHRSGQPPSYAFPKRDVADGVPATDEPAAVGYVRVPWAAASAWYEEEEEIHGHPLNPYHRVDCLRLERRLEVRAQGVLLVEASDVLGLYETSRPPDVYVSRDHVRMGLLCPSATKTYCPYKGWATYWTASVGARSIADVAWCYEEPHPPCAPVAGLLSFDPRLVDLRHNLPSWFEVP